MYICVFVSCVKCSYSASVSDISLITFRDATVIFVIGISEIQNISKNMTLFSETRGRITTFDTVYEVLFCVIMSINKMPI